MRAFLYCYYCSWCICGCSVGGNGVWLASVKFLIQQVEFDTQYFNWDISKSRGSGGYINIRIIAVTKWRQRSEFGILIAN